MELSLTNGGPLVFKCTCSQLCTNGTQPPPPLRQRPSPRSVKASKHVSPTHISLSATDSTGLLSKASCLTDPNEYFPPPTVSCLNSGCLVTRDFGTDHDVLGSPRPLRSDLANVSYELSEDLRAKEIELTERCYGGRLRAQRAARIIQNCYRDYRLRTEYAKLRLEKCSNRKLDPIPRMQPNTSNPCNTVSSTTVHATVALSAELAQPNESHLSTSAYRRPMLHSSGSLEDLVLEQAYVDWALKAATAQAGCTVSESNGLTLNECVLDDNYDAKPSFSSSSSAETTSLQLDKNTPVNASSFAIAPAEDGMVYPNNHIPSNDVNCVLSRDTCHTSNAFSTAPCSCCMTRIAPSALSCELQRRRPSPVRKLSSPASPQAASFSGVDSSANHPSVARIQHSDNNLIQMGIVGTRMPCATDSTVAGIQCTCESFSERAPTAITSKQIRAVPHSQNTIPFQHLRCCHCSNSLPKSGMIACCCTQPPKIMVGNSQTVTSVSSGRHFLVPATPVTTNTVGGLIIDQNKLLRQSLPNNQLRISSGQMLVAVSASTGHLARTHPVYTPQSLPHMSHPSHNQHNPNHTHHHHHHHHHHPHHLPSQTLGHTRNASLPHSQLIHLNADGKSPSTCLVIPAQCNLHGTTVTSLTDGALTHVHTAAQTHNSSSPSVTQFQQLAIAKHQVRQQEKRRKRIYRIGLNIFNKSPLKGIEFLIKYGFLDCTPETIARFLLTRKGLSRVAIGDYLGNTKDELAMTTTRQLMRELDFREQEVDEALRSLLSCFRTPGESQKIVHLLTEFQAAYVEQNSARVKAQFRNTDSVMVLAYAIVMLHTDMYSPNVRPQSKMTRDEFVRNLRGVDAGEDLDRNLLLAIYDRIQQREMSVAPDHTDQVRKIQQHLTGPLRPLNLAIPQRRLVCYCRLYEVPDKSKRERPGAHQREVFLFNDLLLITKAVQKKRRDAAVAYQVRISISLLGIRLAAFETAHHPHGLELLLPIGESNVSLNSKESGLNPASPLTADGRARILVTLNTKTLSDRTRFMEDLQECIVEVAEMDRIRIEEEVVKQMQQKRRLSKQLSNATVGNYLANNYICNSANSYCKGNNNLTKNDNSDNVNRCAFVNSQGRFNVFKVLGDDRTKRQSDWTHPHITASAPTNGKAVRAKTVPREFEAMVRRGATSGIALNVDSGEDPPQETCVLRPGVLDTRGSSIKPCTDSIDENQRLSGDSGLLADLETPTSQCSHTMGSSSSYSPT